MLASGTSCSTDRTTVAQITRTVRRGFYQDDTPTPGGRPFPVAEGEHSVFDQYVVALDAAREALTAAMAIDETIFVVGEGIGPRGGNFNTTAGLHELYGDVRLRDTPIVERGFVGLCAGAAMTGTRPVVDFMFLDFILDSFGELVNQIAKMQYMSSGRLTMPIILRGCIGVGGAAATHHSGNYYPIFTHLPGFRVVLPSNPHDAKGLFATALRGEDPVLFLEHKSLLNSKGDVPAADYAIPFGQAAVCRRCGAPTPARALPRER